jgi:hypothetical protein
MMVDLGLASLAAHATLAWISANAHWFADKAGGAVVALPVREGWEAIKKKLGGTAKGKRAVDEVEAQGGSAASVEGLREPLTEALASDPEFAKMLAGLVVSGSDNQIQIGSGNKAAKVSDSTQVTIHIG